MCRVCLQSPCDPRCPNADPPKAVYTCSRCKNDIYAGKRVFISPEGVVCEDCLKRMSAEAILALMGECLETPVDRSGMAVFLCTECGEPIYKGDKMFISPYGPVCLECLENMSPEEILELFDERMELAEVTEE